MFPRLSTPLSNSSMITGTTARTSSHLSSHLRTICSTHGAGLGSRARYNNAPGTTRHLRSSTENAASTQPHLRLSSSLSATNCSLLPTTSKQSSLTPTFIRQAHSTASPPNMYTTSFAFFEALWEAGVTHVFVNLGSDHPSIIEAMVKGQREAKGNFPRIITCPNEVSTQAN